MTFKFLLAVFSFLALLATPNLFAAEFPSLALLQAGAGLSFANLSASLDKYQDLPCLTKEAKNHVGTFQAHSTQIISSFNETYQNYVKTVTKPMEGNGRCNGGFASVAVESENRKVMTTELEAKAYQLQSSFAEEINTNFVDMDLDTHDDSESQECADLGDKLYDEAVASGALANEALTQFRIGAVVTERKFQQYTAKNSSLGDECGSLPEGLTSIIGTASAQQALVPAVKGKSVNPSSTVTGNIKNEKLVNGAGNNSISSMNFQGGSGLGGGGTSSSNVTDNSQGSALSNREASQLAADKRREALLEQQGFGKLGKVTGDSAELKVRQLLEGNSGQKGDASRTPSSTAAPDREALELMIEMHHNSEQALQNSKTEAAEQAEAGETREIQKSLFDRIHTMLRNKRPSDTTKK